ncbi:MAG: hypothetical protein M1338_02290 [Patescibacteria group bacterium]|nr:hypothetical protein [Patescibacteria group bacterium]
MGKNTKFGLVIILLIVLGLGYWFWTTLPSKSEISSASKLPKEIDVNILKGNLAQKISQRDKNGIIPVTVNAGEIGREDPFSNF